MALHSSSATGVHPVNKVLVEFQPVRHRKSEARKSPLELAR